MTPDQRKIHGQALIDNPVFIEMLENVNKGISRDMDKIKPDDEKGALALVIMRQAANKIVNYIVREAKNEDNKVKEFNAKKKRFSL